VKTLIAAALLLAIVSPAHAETCIGRVKIDAANVIITGGHFIVNGFTLNTGLELGAHSTLTTVSNNLMSAVNGGALTNGIKIDSGASLFTIQGNSFLFTTNPIVYAPNGETALIKDNIGVDDTCPNVASAASISLPNASTCVNITGSTAKRDSTNNKCSGRSVLYKSQKRSSLNTGGAAATQFCTAATLAPSASKTANSSSATYSMKSATAHSLFINGSL
jgi:hypothetical protein